MAIGPVSPIIGDAPVGVGAHGPSPAAPAGGGPHPAPTATPKAPEPANPLQAALDALISRALVRQDGLAPVFADAKTLLALPPGVLPPAVLAALSDLDGLAVRGTAGLADLLRRLAAGGLPGAGRPGDIAAVLWSLRAALEAWTGRSRSDGPSRPAGLRPDPPRRSAPPVTEPVPALPDPAAEEPRAIAARLLGETDRALERLLLHQSAALPDDGRLATRANDTADMLVFPVPLAGPGGVSVAEVRIEREPPENEREEPGGRAHRVEIALDLEPLGPMRARLGLLADSHVIVGLWCERAAAARVLEAHAPSLRQGLQAAGLQVADVAIHLGRPPDARAGMAAPVHHRVDVSL
ncbi:flagellar hook-length control protein FliK [Chthonobacter rhizosphaerae]|uniref:flagellar hook-length control protein FliK n=1 Tax=Chthonobacter rhizosphaerae TaxID=2735553 RepID=UPI0015EFD496|nr:flagellar hook-length control protein FliK [Chthonobacter rhizosphaerae]